MVEKFHPYGKLGVFLGIFAEVNIASKGVQEAGKLNGGTQRVLTFLFGKNFILVPVKSWNYLSIIIWHVYQLF